MDVSIRFALPWQVLAFPAALIGGLFYAFVILRLGRRHFSPRLLGLTIGYGAIAAFIAGFCESLVDKAFVAMPLATANGFRAFVMAGGVEEFVKILVILVFAIRHFERRSPRDFVLSAASTGLGFALMENVFYVLREPKIWQSMSFTRAVTSLPEHVMLGFILGAALIPALSSRRWLSFFVVVLFSWIGVAFLHGLFDFPIMLLNDTLKIDNARSVNDIFFTDPIPDRMMRMSMLVVAATATVAAFFIFPLAWTSRGLLTSEPRQRLSPRWIDRLVFSRLSGQIIGGAVTLAGVIYVCVASYAFLQGASASSAVRPALLALPMIFLGLAVWSPTRGSLPSGAAPVIRRATWTVVGVLIAFGLLFDSGDLQAAGREMIAEFLLRGVQFQAFDGDVSAVIRNLAKAADFGAPAEEVYLRRAMLHRMLQQYPQEHDDLERAVAAAPHNLDLQVARAESFVNLHRIDEAIAQMDLVLSQRGDDAVYLTHRADYAVIKGDYPAARVFLARAFAVKPDSIEALVSAADFERRLGNKDRAFQAVNQAISESPERDNPYFLRGRFDYALGDMPGAISDLSHAEALGHNPYVSLWLRLAHLRAGSAASGALVDVDTGIVPRPWPFPLVDYFKGNVSEADVFKAAPGPDQLCEANFYVGMSMILKDRSAHGEALLRRASDICPVEFMEADASRQEVRRLDQETLFQAHGRFEPQVVVLLADDRALQGDQKWRVVEEENPWPALILSSVFETGEGNPSGALSLRFDRATGPGFALHLLLRPPGGLVSSGPIQVDDVRIVSSVDPLATVPFRVAGTFQVEDSSTTWVSLGDNDVFFDLEKLQRAYALEIRFVSSGVSYDLRFPINDQGRDRLGRITGLWRRSQQAFVASHMALDDTAVQNH